ncbi:hypothetical protein JCM8097_005437 [Rhodosporidiobolus ruineniae]
MSTISQYEAHAGSGDLGEGYQAPQNPGKEFEKGKEGSHSLQDGKDERSHANTKAKEEEKKDREGGNPYAGAEGNKKGSDIDRELQADDELRLKEKGLK